MAGKWHEEGEAADFFDFGVDCLTCGSKCKARSGGMDSFRSADCLRYYCFKGSEACAKA